MILVKRWKETTATCAIIEGTVGDESLKEFAKTIMDDLYKERPNAVWAQVEIRCSVKVIEELKTAPPRPDGA